MFDQITVRQCIGPAIEPVSRRLNAFGYVPPAPIYVAPSVYALAPPVCAPPAPIYMPRGYRGGPRMMYDAGYGYEW